MSLQPIEIKARRTITMATGIHLVSIHDILVLRNAAKQPVLTPEGYSTLIVIFKNEKSEIYEHHYLMDKALKQKSFESMIAAAGVIAENGNPKKKDAVGKQLWIALKEVHYMDNGVPIMYDDQPKIERFIFKMAPYIEGDKRPKVAGDPLAEGATEVSGGFIEFKNISIETTISAENKLENSINNLKPGPSYKKSMAKTVDKMAKENNIPQKEEEEQPNFGDEPIYNITETPVFKEPIGTIQKEDFNFDSEPNFS